MTGSVSKNLLAMMRSKSAHTQHMISNGQLSVGGKPIGTEMTKSIIIQKNYDALRTTRCTSSYFICELIILLLGFVTTHSAPTNVHVTLLGVTPRAITYQTAWLIQLPLARKRLTARTTYMRNRNGVIKSTLKLIGNAKEKPNTEVYMYHINTYIHI